jgi:ABC-2 type transport system ATP-binding protein
VRSPALDTLIDLVSSPDVSVTPLEPSLAEISGLDAEQIGELAAANGLPLYELTPQHASLEQAFMELTREELEFQGRARTTAAPEEALK